MPATGPRVRLTTLGRLTLVASDDRELLSGRRKELALLAYLARRSAGRGGRAATGRAVTREELAALLWGERESSKARESLRHALLQLRRALGEAIVVTPERVHVDPCILELDAAAFERDLAAGRLRDAVARWRGDFLAGVEDTGGQSFRAWVEAEREGLRHRLASAFDHLIAEMLGRGEWDEAVAWATSWTELNPLDEQAHRRLIEALKGAGRPDEALAHHATFTARVRDELGHDPSPACSALASGLARAARRPRTSRPGSAALLTPDMVGREAVLAELIAAWYEARAGRPAAALIAGDEGLGKSRLCQELASWVKSGDAQARVLMSRAYETERDVPWSAARRLLAGLADAPGLLGAAPTALRTVTRLVPTVARALHAGTQAAATAGPPDSATSTVTMEMEAVCEVLEAVASESPVLLILDDASFADGATQQALAGLLRRLLPGLMIVMTGPPTALSASALAESLRDSRAVRRLQLQPLDASETELLIGSIIALDPGERRLLAASVHAEAQGNPFYVTELVFSLADDGTLRLGPDGRWRVDPALVERRLPLPSGVRETVRTRLGTLDDDERLCLQAVAGLDRRVDAVTLERSTGLTTDRLVAALDRLLARRLLREATTNGGRAMYYEFAHEMVRRVTRELTPAACRRALEEAAAESPPSVRAGDVLKSRATFVRWARAASLAATAALGLALVVWMRLGEGDAGADRPTIAIVGIDVAGGDTAAAWLADGLPHMIAANLARSAHVEVVSPARTRAFGLRAHLEDSVGLSTPQVLEVARRLHATIVVRGALTRAADTALMLSIIAHDVATGRVVHSSAFIHRDARALADKAAARLLGAEVLQAR